MRDGYARDVSGRDTRRGIGDREPLGHRQAPCRDPRRGGAAALLGAGAEVLLLPKQVYTEPDAGRSMTLAVARIPYPKRRVV